MRLQSFYADLRESGRVDGSGGLSARTVIQIHRVLHRAFVHAERWGLLARNPCDGASLSKADRFRPTTLSPEESIKLLEATRDTEYFFAPVMLSLMTGMRRGEVLGLHWDAVDLDSGRISVVESLEETTENGLRWKDPKTPDSIRVVQLPKMAVRELRWWKEKQEEQKALLQGDYEDNNLVCSRTNGRPIKPDNFSSTFGVFVRKLEITPIRFHDLRHSQATHLIATGTPVKVVSERLGHSTVQITQDLYIHVLPTMQQQAVDSLDILFGETQEQ